MMEREHRHINTDSDSELLLNLFADELQRRNVGLLTAEDLFDATKLVMRKVSGAYAVVLLINRVGVLAFRDPNGIRPLCFGMRNSSYGADYAIASESVAIDALDPQAFRLIRDVQPGEAIFISTQNSSFQSQIVGRKASFRPCLFEYIYFARPDSLIDGVQVYEARAKMGEKLALKIMSDGLMDDIDIVMPIPETSRTSALTCASTLNKPYREGFVKNRYIARTFIMPGQEMRRKTVRLKLNAIRSEFKDKTVLLIDDSIVRGTTSIELIQMAREAGAKKVYFASAAPPVAYPNVYGIDIPTRQELVASGGRSIDDIAQILGADRVIYNDLADVIDCVTSLNPSLFVDQALDASCFDGQYITGDVDEEYLLSLEGARGSASNIVTAATVVMPTPVKNAKIVLGARDRDSELLSTASIPSTPRRAMDESKGSRIPSCSPPAQPFPMSVGSGYDSSSEETGSVFAGATVRMAISQQRATSGSCEPLHNHA